MSDDGWNVPRSYRREAIAPPVPPEEGTLDALRQTLAADARVAEAWIVAAGHGTRFYSRAEATV